MSLSGNLIKERVQMGIGHEVARQLGVSRGVVERALS